MPIIPKKPDPNSDKKTTSEILDEENARTVREKPHAYYDDDAHGYEAYDPDIEDAEEAASED